MIQELHELVTHEVMVEGGGGSGEDIEVAVGGVDRGSNERAGDLAVGGALGGVLGRHVGKELGG